MMDPHILDCKLIEAIVLWILAGDHAYPKTGSILVRYFKNSACIQLP
jgi:hypothetical protein